jgi:uncharacterized membrane protein YqhA
MSRVLSATRYLIIVPILGLLLAASIFFILGGVALFRQLIDLVINVLGGVAPAGDESEKGVIIFEVVEYVHLFLVGTVLYITAAGLYQLFIQELNLPKWLKIDSTEELETNLIGVTVVVLAVNFMGAVFVGHTENLLGYGAGIALPIAALGLFVGLRAWSIRMSKITAAEEQAWERRWADRGTDSQPARDEAEGQEQG